jgi:propanediol dehydratase small subunit
MDFEIACSHNEATMKNDAIFRLRLPRKELEAIKSVARAHGRPASDYVRSLIGERVKREYAAMRVREMLGAMKPGRMTDEEAMALADEAKHASRR